MFKSFLSEHSLKDYNFCSDLFPTIEDREFWDAFPNGDCIKEAEAELDYKWPVIKATDFMEFKKSGGRTVMETIHFDRRRHLVLFALAELKENKGRFIAQLTDGIFTTCEESFWGLSAHMPHHTYTLEDIPMPNEDYIDLYAAETAEHLAIISKVLRKPLSEFCPRILERIEYELDRRIRSPYIVRRDFVWMGYNNKKVNNWNPWIISNLLTVFLLTENCRARLDRAIEKMFVELQYYYSYIPEDGGCEEGSSYYGHSGLSLFEILYQLKISSKGAIDLFGDERIRRVAAYAKKARMVSDVYINVGDSHVEGRLGFMLNIFAFGKETMQRDVMNMAAAVLAEKNDHSCFFRHTLLNMRRIIDHGKFYREIKDFNVTYPINDTLELLPALEVAVLRRGDMTLSMKGGNNNEGHGHNDVGSFSLYCGKEPVLVDVGINTYTRFTFEKQHRYTMIPWTRSPYHNLPIINGAEQKYGKEYKSDGFECTEELLKVFCAKAYDVDAGIEKFDRSLALSDTVMTLTDSFAFDSEDKEKVTEVFMSVLPTSVENNEVIIGGRFKMSSDAGIFKVENMPFDDKKLTADWNTDHCSRIMLECDGEKEICVKVEKI